jgi:mono/diheme cytochrome c family protein
MRRTIHAVTIGVLLAGGMFFAAQARQGKEPEKKVSPAKAPSGSSTKGKALYKENCGICHYAANTSQKIGPGLKGIYKRGKFADGKKVDDASMKEWILKGGKDMPSFEDALTEQQIQDLIAYLRTL